MARELAEGDSLNVAGACQTAEEVDGALISGTAIPETAFALFHMSLATFAPALMVGAWAGRARLGWVLGFAALWVLVVYAPIAHWIWSGGWLARQFGTIDYAGGLVVHTSAGVSALVACCHGVARPPACMRCRTQA